MSLLSHRITLSLSIWGNIRLFSKAAAPFYTLNIRLWGFWFLFVLVYTCYCLFFFIFYFVLFCFYYSHPCGCEGVSYCILICISLMADDVEHLFMYCWPCMSLKKCIYLWRNVYSFLVHIFWIQISFQLYCLELFSSILWVVFLLLTGVFETQNF